MNKKAVTRNPMKWTGAQEVSTWVEGVHIVLAPR